MTVRIDPPEGVTLEQIHEEIRGLDKTIELIKDDTDMTVSEIADWTMNGPGRFLFVVRSALAHAYGEPT
jgi:hypothetical protein